jgi:putative transposase
LRTEKDTAKKRTGYKQLRTQYGFSEYALSAFATVLKNKLWKDHLGAHEPQTLAKRVFSALDEYSFKKRGKPRFKGRKRPLHSLEGKSAASAIRYQVETGCLLWAGLLMPVLMGAPGKDAYLDEAMTRRIKFSRVVWRVINGKTRYFAQLVLEGKAPATSLSVIGTGGLDIGPSTVAAFTESHVGLHTFCPSVEPCAKRRRVLSRKADRMLRSNNPDCFDEKGSWIKGKRATKSSRRLKEVRTEIAECERVLQATRANEHGQRVNQLLSHANTWHTETLSYRSFQKNFGKSVKNRAPGLFINLLKRRAESAGGKVIELNTRKLKMSQYDHSTGTYTKKPLSLRWHKLADDRGLVQRDVYSALLACCTEGERHNPPKIEMMLAAQESVLKRAGLWKTQSASVVAIVPTPANAGRADGTLKKECTQLQRSTRRNPA